ncbi:MAG: hypothetical protein ABIA21_04140 [Candidatus Aenigmatarchaeota archaeon]
MASLYLYTPSSFEDVLKIKNPYKQLRELVSSTEYVEHPKYKEILRKRVAECLFDDDEFFELFTYIKDKQDQTGIRRHCNRNCTVHTVRSAMLGKYFFDMPRSTIEVALGHDILEYVLKWYEAELKREECNINEERRIGICTETANEMREKFDWKYTYKIIQISKLDANEDYSIYINRLLEYPDLVGAKTLDSIDNICTMRFLHPWDTVRFMKKRRQFLDAICEKTDMLSSRSDIRKAVKSMIDVGILYLSINIHNTEIESFDPLTRTYNFEYGDKRPGNNNTYLEELREEFAEWSRANVTFRRILEPELDLKHS